jgi:hypothetical protein
MKQIDHIAKQLRQLAFCLDTFVMGSATAEEYLSSYSDLSDLGRSAFTKAILVDYASVFMTHKFDENLKEAIPTKYLKKNEAFDKKLHDALMEVRNNLVAHASYESPGLGVTVATYTNTMPHTHQHKKVSVPVQYFLQNQTMGYIKNVDLIEKMVEHFKVCEQLTKEKASELVSVLGDLLLENAPTIDALDFVETLEIVSANVAAKDDTDELSIEAKSLEHLLIGRENVQFLLTRMRMDRPFTGDYIGNGYRIISKPDSPEITVSFLANSTSQ